MRKSDFSYLKQFSIACSVLLDIDMELDDAQIESDLLREVEQLTKKHINENDFLDSSSEEDDVSDLEGILLDQGGIEASNDNLNASNDHILASLPTFELFQSASMLATRAYNQIVEKVEESRISFFKDESSSLNGQCKVDELNLRLDLMVGEKVKVANDIEEEDSNFNFATSPQNMVGLDTKIDLKDVNNETEGKILVNLMNLPKVEGRSTVNECKNMAWFEERNDDKDKEMMCVSLEEIERETEEEQLFKRIKRKESQRHREILVSKERVNHTRLDNAATTLQTVTRSFLSRQHLKRKQLFDITLAKLSKVLKVALLKTSLKMWAKKIIYIRKAHQIGRWLERHYKKRKALFEERMAMRCKVLRWYIDVVQFRRCQKSFCRWRSFAVCETQREKEIRRAQKIASCVLLIQCVVRAHLSRLRFQRIKADLKSSSTLIIQSCWRGFTARKTYQIFQDNRKANAAIRIQGVFRSREVRRQFKETLCANHVYQDPELDEILGNDVDLLVEDIIDITDQSADWEPELPKQIAIQRLSEQGKTQEGDESSLGTTHEVRPQPSLKHEQLMDEWNISDKRVIKSMMRRKERMNRNKRREEKSKRLSNPLFRLKKILKRKI